MRHRRQTIVTLIGLALTVALGACIGPSEMAEPTQVVAPVDLDGTEWALTSLNGSSLIEGTNITLNFTEGRVGGFSGCNSYGGEYTADQGTLTVHQLAVTLQDCREPEGVMGQEAAYVGALQAAAAYRVADDRLEIENAVGETALVFAVKEELSMDPSHLVGTEWQLVSWNGDSPLDGSTVTLAFHDEYRVSGHAGCRSYVATYEASGDDIKFPWLAMAGDVCSESEALMEQEGEYTTVLEWATNYRLGQGQLEVLTARGEALTYKSLPEDAAASLEGTTWALTAFIEERTVEGMAAPLPMPTDLLPETEITATFKDARVRGSAGCNTYSAAYVRAGSSLSLETPAATEMACSGPAGVMEQEQRYLNILRGVTTCHIHGSQLWLETDDGRALVFTVKATDYNLADLIEDLRAIGLTVEPTEEVVDHGFAMKGRRLLVDGAPVFVYQFADITEAKTASAGISTDKYSMTITRLEGEVTVEMHSDWMETPHLHRKGRLIVITGDHPDVLNTLDAVLGPQFAGG